MPAKRDTLAPERERLAAAQEDLRRFDADLAALRQNDTEQSQHYYASDRAADGADLALRRAIGEQSRADAMISRTRSYEAPPPPVSLVEANVAAKARLAEARLSLDGVRQEIRDMEKRRDDQLKVVEKAALAVIAAHAAEADLVAEVDRLQRAALDAGLRLKWLADHHAIEVRTADFQPLPVARILSRVERDWDLRDIPGDRPWEAALTALMTDSMSEVP